MTRVLFVVPPLVGHINPAASVAAALVEQGHEVAWAGHPELLAHLVGPTAQVFPCTALPAVPRPADLVGPAALKFLWEEFLIPLADAMAPGVDAALREFAPDVVVADQQALAGGILAQARGLAWVTSATTSAELTDPLAGMPKVAAWVEGLLAELRDRIAGGAGEGDPRFSPYAILAFTSAELLGGVDLPEQVHLVGPAIGGRPAQAEFPWAWLEGDRPTVLVSLGTANSEAGNRFLTTAAQALGELPLRAVILDPTGVLGEVSSNILVRERVPQLELLPHLSAVLCHAGHNTVCESLAHGLPLVVAPIRDDQPVVAGQVVAAGAGVRLRFGRADAARIAAAVTEVLTEPGYRTAARRIADSFRVAGGSTRAAEQVLSVADPVGAPG